MKNRWWLYGLIGLIILSVVLAIAVASIGSQLDATRLERDDLEFEMEDLRAQQETLQGERDVLKTQADEQRKTVEQLKTELERAHNQSPAQPQTSGTPTTNTP